MTREERSNWIINIENSASFISSEVGETVIDGILSRFRTKAIEEIADNDLPELFSKLYAIEADLRSDL